MKNVKFTELITLFIILFFVGVNGTAKGQQPQLAVTDKKKDNFYINLPNDVSKGDPFMVSFSGNYLEKVDLLWKGKNIKLTPGKHGQPAGQCDAILYIDLNEKNTSLPLQVTLTIKGKTQSETYLIGVKKKNFSVQRLKVAQKYVTPPAHILEKIRRDQKAVRIALSGISSERYWSYPFKRPVPGSIGSAFGLRRVFNGKERNPHRGLDFNAKKGDPILACESGKVVLVDSQYYSGNIVIIDHGLGVFTMYLHLSEFKVKTGDFVKRGDIVGLVGSTGRVTGPHLHLGFGVLGVSVNAAPMIEGLEE